MPKNNQKNGPKGLNDVNYYEATGSPNPRPGEADAVIDASQDAVRQNMKTKKAGPPEDNR